MTMTHTLSATPAAFTDHFHITIHGKGAHAARPHEGIDSIVTGSHIVSALAAAGLDVTRFQGGNSWNVLPPEVVVEGVLHSEDASARQRSSAQAATLVSHIARAFRAEVQLAWQPQREAERSATPRSS
ncbi:hypothetical protein Y788_07195 [Pantoea dispersa 625]|nr:hypothetical protein Y788_07195 [Pantoea dispersa 625]